MKDNNVNWINFVQENIWSKDDDGYGVEKQGVDKQTYITRNFVTHFPCGVLGYLNYRHCDGLVTYF